MPGTQLPGCAFNNIIVERALVGISSNGTPTFLDGASTLRWWNWTPIHTNKEKYS